MKVEELTVEEIVRIVKQSNVKVVISVNSDDNGYEVMVEPAEKQPITWSASTTPCIVPIRKECKFKDKYKEQEHE